MSHQHIESQDINELGLAVLDALLEEIAVIDLFGKIVFTNHAWKQFATENNYAQKYVTKPYIGHVRIVDFDASGEHTP